MVYFYWAHVPERGFSLQLDSRSHTHTSLNSLERTDSRVSTFEMRARGDTLARSMEKIYIQEARARARNACTLLFVWGVGKFVCLVDTFSARGCDATR